MSTRAEVLIIFSIVILIVGAVFLAVAEKADLLIDGETMMWGRPNFNPTQDRVTAVLHKGDVLHITKCLDMKTDFVYQVRLPNGQYGYVSPGEYRLEVFPVWRSGGTVVSNCH